MKKLRTTGRACRMHGRLKMITGDRMFVGNPRRRCRWEKDIKMYLKKIK
jgi:hypothetical protein